MKKGLTEMVFILDRSGSMCGLEKDTIGGFNSMIKQQKQAEGSAVVSTVLFDDEIKVLHDRVAIDKIREMTDEDYFTCGCTALLDAVGGAIHHIGNIHKYARNDDVPEKTIFVIITDGLENSLSNAFDYADRVLVEPAIENLREINCSVLGDRHSARSSVCEEPLNATDILSYEDKYIGNASKSGSKGMASTQRRIPADIPKETENEIREMAVRAFRVLGCSGVSRIDFMIDASTGKVWLNEINTIPGSLSFYLWEPLGVKYTELIDEMISLAMKRERERESITYSFDTNVLSGIKLGGKKTGKM